ncbi:MAG: hypothetical protein OXE77_07505 [Flavobacteriaceae bacterium]|nr:hypothetical protein [Flavobacteriaceae bacterium]MCY4266834.1 hypothetical protein [Flavobacteriaceae bacterium]MCY4299629.1 hypothetical protein [Flavobacteriaceae bacterium]
MDYNLMMVAAGAQNISSKQTVCHIVGISTTNVLIEKRMRSKKTLKLAIYHRLMCL